MILVDSSVWIRFLSNRAPWSTELDRLLNAGEVAGHDLIYGELLIGDSGGRRGLLNIYRLMPRAAMIAHEEVVAFVQAHNLNGAGIGWIDAHLLASALVSKTRLWTADERLGLAAKRLNVGYLPS